MEIAILALAGWGLYCLETLVNDRARDARVREQSRALRVEAAYEAALRQDAKG